MTELNLQIKAMDEDAFNEIYKYIFTSMRRQFKQELTIFDPRASGYLDVLAFILNESDDFKDLFINNRGDGMVWIPGPGGINLEKGIGSCTGDILESSSVLGPFFQLSFLPNTLNLKADGRFLKNAEKVQ